MLNNNQSSYNDNNIAGDNIASQYLAIIATIVGAKDDKTLSTTVNNASSSAIISMEIYDTIYKLIYKLNDISTKSLYSLLTIHGTLHLIVLSFLISILIPSLVDVYSKSRGRRVIVPKVAQSPKYMFS